MEPARLRPDGLFYAVGCARDLTGCRLQDDVVGEQRADNISVSATLRPVAVGVALKMIAAHRAGENGSLVDAKDVVIPVSGTRRHCAPP